LSAKLPVKNYAEASAPGRLDVMGGIADYSGSLVLQMPIAQKTVVSLYLRDDFQCIFRSTLSDREILTAHVDYREYLNHGQVDYKVVHEKLKSNLNTSWIGYVLGGALVLQKEKGIDFRGATFEIKSTVPLGKGVSSSASIEVACMKALCEVFDLDLPGTELPLLAQRVENFIVGAPCGLMDQLASYFGESNKLLPILCQPDQVDEPISIPDEIQFIGIDSGIRHSVAGASYSDVRAAAFMGYSIILQAMGVSTEIIKSVKTKNDFTSLPFAGYLSNISPNQYENSFLTILPKTISGKEFLDKYQVSVDNVTQIDRARTYPLRASTSHPIYEHHRVTLFKNLLAGVNAATQEEERPHLLKKIGELMYQSHDSYSACGLGAERTDEIVSLSKNIPGVYGAKITGGGNGGTVCLLTDRKATSEVKAFHQMLCDKYKQDLILFT
jgi:galactokinase